MKTEAFAELERSVHAALETYSNVHRGSGHNSMVSTHLFERARDIVLEYLKLRKSEYKVVFCTPRRLEKLKARLAPGSYYNVSSQDTGLPLGIRALAVRSASLPKGAPFQAGGGTASLVSPGWVVWAQAPDRFEAGTPPIVNVIAFAKALRMELQTGNPVSRFEADQETQAAQILYRDELEKFSGLELLNELRKTHIGRRFLIPTTGGARPFVNLDNSASTPTFSPIWHAAFGTWRQPKHVRQEIIAEVKSICAKTLGAPLAAYDIIFTSNATESINLVAESLGGETGNIVEPVVLNTLLEHNSNELPWRMVPGHSLVRLAVDAEGFIDLNELDNVLCGYNQKSEHGKKRISLVAVSGASNVLGAYNDLAEIGRITHNHGARLLVDAAQLVAHRTVEIEKWGIDYLAFSAHKIYAPFGAGVLVARKGLLSFNPVELELIRLSGEENAGGIAALGKALVLLQRIGMDVIREEEQTLTGRLLRGMAKMTSVKVYGIDDASSPRFARKSGVVVFNVKNMFANEVARELAVRGGIGVRYGCHCAHMLIKNLLSIHPLLQRFQGLMASAFPRIKFPGLARVSLGIENSQEDIDTFINVLGNIAFQPRQSHSDIKQKMNDFVSTAALKVYSQPE